MTQALDITRSQAMAHAARLLSQAETETDRELMELYTVIAEAWLTYAELCDNA